mgnify:CR=1 FL=1
MHTFRTALLTCLLVLAVLGSLAPSPVFSTGLVRLTPTTVPFLRKPFGGQARVTSHFDHHYPDRDWDDQVVIFNGTQANAIDGIIERGWLYKGGYWSPALDYYVYYDGHDAYDYDTGHGTIVAAADGKVLFAGPVNSRCGDLNFVNIDHGNGYRTQYIHMDYVTVTTGQMVKAGDPVGVSGSTGCVTGPHLHFVVQHNGFDTDLYGWEGDYPDPLLDYSGEAATWLWLPEEPEPGGELIAPKPDTAFNGPLDVVFNPAGEGPPVVRVAFTAWYDQGWHELGVDEDGADGWKVRWQPPGGIKDQEVLFHAQVYDAEGHRNAGIPMVTGVLLDRTPPDGELVTPTNGATVNEKEWLSVRAWDELSGVAWVAWDVRVNDGEWREIGRDADADDGLDLEWVAGDIPDGTSLTIRARLYDLAGNEFITAPAGVALDRAMPGGRLVSPISGTATRQDIVLEFAPDGSAGIARVAFDVRILGEWRLAGVDEDGSDGWHVTWPVAGEADQRWLWFRARVYDGQGRFNDGFRAVRNVQLDRQPPRGWITRPAVGTAVAAPVEIVASVGDEISGVSRVAFLAGYDGQWHAIGVDEDGSNGWAIQWKPEDLADRGDLALRIDLMDRAGNTASWSSEPRIRLDRVPPVARYVAPADGAELAGRVVLAVEAEDAGCGVERVIFYAGYDGRWHNLGMDATEDDGWTLEWDTAPLGMHSDVTLTAWVYDCALNYTQVAEVRGLRLDGAPAPTESPTPTATATSSPTATPSPSPTITPTATPTFTPTPTDTPLPTATPTPIPTSSLIAWGPVAAIMLALLALVVAGIVLLTWHEGRQ